MSAPKRPTLEQLESRLVLSTTTFVQGLYRDVLHREASQGEVAGHVQSLDRGASADAVTRAFLNSGERHHLEAGRLYQEILHRSGDAGGIDDKAQALSRGASLRDVALGMLTSAEYQAAHPDDRSFILGLYEDLLHRSAAEVEIQGQAAGLGRGRAAVAQGILGSGERANVTVGDFYVEFLHRSGTAAERDGHARGVVGTGHFEDAARAFLVSGEFATRVQFEIEHGVLVRTEVETEHQLEVEHGPEVGHGGGADDAANHDAGDDNGGGNSGRR